MPQNETAVIKRVKTDEQPDGLGVQLLRNINGQGMPYKGCALQSNPYRAYAIQGTPYWVVPQFSDELSINPSEIVLGPKIPRKPVPIVTRLRVFKQVGAEAVGCQPGRCTQK